MALVILDGSRKDPLSRSSASGALRLIIILVLVLLGGLGGIGGSPFYGTGYYGVSAVVIPPFVGMADGRLC